jgi:hypothetical protein
MYCIYSDLWQQNISRTWRIGDALGSRLKEPKVVVGRVVREERG